MAFPQIGLYPVSQLQVAAFFFRSHIDARRLQPFKVFLTQLRIDDMEGLLTALEAFLDKRQQHLILLVAVVEEGADMTFCAKHGSGEPDRLVALLALTGSSFTKIGVITDGIHRQSPSTKLDLVGLPAGSPAAHRSVARTRRNGTPWRTGSEDIISTAVRKAAVDEEGPSAGQSPSCLQAV